MTKCVICKTEHDRMYGDKPSMYCPGCAKLKGDIKGVISVVTPLLFLSDYEGAKGYDGSKICVHESTKYVTEKTSHIPILKTFPVSPLDRSGAKVNPEALDEAVTTIAIYTKTGRAVLVHCAGGVERSPLTVAHYLVEHEGYKDLQSAYAHLKAVRPVVSERYEWL